MQKIKILSVLSLCLLVSCSTLQQLAYVPSRLENIQAVKELLNGSAFRALAIVANSANQGIEGLLPKEVRPVISTLRTIGLGNEIDQLDRKVGMASKAVLSESTGLMEDAIYQLDIADAVGIIKGEPNAATALLKNAMYDAVKNRYSQKLDGELSKIDETKHWETAVSAYNLFAKNKIEGSLSEFIAEKAVDAVFLTMSNEETEIRKDVNVLEKEVLSRVFDYHLGK